MKDTIQLNTGRASVLLVSLPEGADNYHIREGRLFWDEIKRNHSTKLPPGNWIEVGWSDSLSEDQAIPLVHPYLVHGIVIYHNYLEGDEFETSLESWQSFLSANNIKERKLVLIDNNK